MAALLSERIDTGVVVFGPFPSVSQDVSRDRDRSMVHGFGYFASDLFDASYSSKSRSPLVNTSVKSIDNDK